MKLYVIRTEEHGDADGDCDITVHVEFSERKARRYFRLATGSVQYEGDEEPPPASQPPPTVELSRVELLDLPKRELVKALLEAGDYAQYCPGLVGDCTVLEAWEYVASKEPEGVSDAAVYTQ